MAAQWFYLDDEYRPSLPVDWTELRRLAETGIVRPGTIISECRGGYSGRAEEVMKGIFPRYMKLRWLFNGLMLAGAVLGWVIFGGLGHIQDTMRHTGPGVVEYENDLQEEVSESKFKRHNYVGGGMMIFVGVFVWIMVAWAAKENRDERETHLANLNAGRFDLRRLTVDELTNQWESLAAEIKRRDAERRPIIDDE